MITTELLAYPSPHAAFLKLNDDISSLVVGHLIAMEGAGLSDALSMSLVCKRIRRVALSFLFRVVRWPSQNHVKFFPSPLWPFIRQISFTQVQWASHHFESLNILSSVLPYLHNLTTFNYCEHKFGPNPLFISTLASCSSSLTTLVLNTVFFSFDALTSFSEFSGIQRLSLRQSEGKSLSAAPEPKRILLLQRVANLVLACHETLSHLELPGEFCRAEALAFPSTQTRLTALKTLVLQGYPPLNVDSIPIWNILPFMPSLSRLEVLLKRRVIGARTTRYMMMPCDPPRVRDEVSVFSSQLDTLVIANPMMQDRVFTHFPPCLKSLTLDFVPEWEGMSPSKDLLAYHRPEKMLNLLSTIRESSVNSPLELESLCIKMGWCVTPDILRCICRTFSNLKSMELQGSRYANLAARYGSDMDLYVSALSGFQCLRVLQIAVNLPEDPYEYSTSAERNIGSVEQAARKWAEALAVRLPNLRSLAFEIRPHFGRPSGQRFIPSQANWAWFSTKNGTAVRIIDG